MNLELVEQKALKYLQQVSNPLVPIDRLFAHLRDEEELLSLDDKELTAFFSDHELFTVMETPGLGQSPEVDKVLKENTLTHGLCVILSTRIPSRKDMGEMMMTQLETLKDALLKASASTSGGKQAEIHATLSKVEEIRAKIDSL